MAQTHYQSKNRHFLAYICDFVESSVSAKTEVSARDIVGDGAGDDHHRDAEGLVVLPLLCHLQDAVVSLKAADDTQGIDLVLLQGSSDLLVAYFTSCLPVEANKKKMHLFVY